VILPFTFTLRGLERDGLVTRTVFPTTPQRVDYELTKRGSTLWEAVEPLSSWARAHVSEILTSREQFDETDAGHPRLLTIAATQRTEGSDPLLLMVSDEIVHPLICARSHPRDSRADLNRAFRSRRRKLDDAIARFAAVPEAQRLLVSCGAVVNVHSEA
jgi:ribosomal protein S12 methylthiotransferase accessory factor YcaO